MYRGHATRFWLVVRVCSVYSTWPVCINMLTILVINLNGMYPRILSRCINWARSHGSCGAEFEEEGDKVRVFLRTWDIDIFGRVCVATLVRYSSDPHQEVTALGRVMDALGPDVSVASTSGGSTVLVEAFCEHLGNRNRQKLIDDPVFDLRLFGRCLQWTASSVFGSLDGLALTEFIINRLKGAETRDWMSSGSALKKAILTNDLSMPHLVDVVANIIGVWPLIVSYLKETGRKDDGDSLVVRSSTFGHVGALSYPYLLCCVLFQKKGIDGYFYLDQMARMKFRLLHLLLEVCK